jgi:hypothetical protein
MASIINASSTGSGGIVQTADASGVLQLQNNGTIAVTVTGGNVGVGTESPTAQLEISRSTTSAYSTMRLSNTGASGKTYEIGVGGNTAAAGYANNLYFYDSTAGAIRMAITSAGQVTTPLQPAFRAVTTGGATTTTGVISFASAPVNIGGHFSTSTNRFTAPVAGQYLFCGNMYISANTTAYGLIQFRVNGSQISYSETQTVALVVTLSFSVVVTLSAGDYAEVAYNTGGGRSFFAGNAETNFSGFLIG